MSPLISEPDLAASARAHAQVSALADLLPPLAWPGPLPIPAIPDQAILAYLPRFAHAMREAFELAPLLRPGALGVAFMLALEKKDPRAARSILARRGPDLHLAGVSGRILKRIHEACSRRWLTTGSRGQTVALDQNLAALAMQAANPEHSQVNFQELLAYAHAWRCVGLGSVFKSSTAHEPILALSAQFATRLSDEASLAAQSQGKSKGQLDSDEGRLILAAEAPFSQATHAPWRSLWMALAVCEALAKEAALSLEHRLDFWRLYSYPSQNAQGGIPTGAGPVDPGVFVRQRIQQIFSEQEAKLLRDEAFGSEPAVQEAASFAPSRLNAHAPAPTALTRKPPRL